jgi:hypothetical protein
MTTLGNSKKKDNITNEVVIANTTPQDKKELAELVMGGLVNVL